MKALRDARDFEQVLAVRRIERSKAEMHAASARKKLHDIQDHRTGVIEALADDHRLWVGVASGASLDLYGARALSTAISQKTSDLRHLDSRVEDAKDSLAQARADLARALSRLDATETLSRSAQRRLGRARDEAILAEAQDRAAQRSAIR
jgi:hypothetical protein